MKKKNQIAQNALRLLAARCPRLTSMCYWAGTSSIAIEELGHRESFDLDFHTHQALVNVSPILAELQAEFADAAIAEDLEGYPEVDPKEAGLTRDRLLLWLKTLAHRGQGSGG